MNMEKKEIKLTCLGEPQFFVNEKKRTVACKLYWCLSNDSRFRVETSVGIAKCTEEDVFDVEIGKKVAHAKAENKAYNRAARKLEEVGMNYLREAHCILEFLHKADFCQCHNLKCIDRITSENE